MVTLGNSFARGTIRATVLNRSIRVQTAKYEMIRRLLGEELHDLFSNQYRVDMPFCNFEVFLTSKEAALLGPEALGPDIGEQPAIASD
jgi:hypothetical protein